MKYSILMLSAVICASHSYAINKHTPARDTVQHVSMDTLEVSAPAGLPPYQPSAPRIWDIKNTRVALTFNWQAKTADAREWIKLSPYLYPTDSIVLDAKGMRIDSVQLEGKTRTNLKYTYAADQLTIHFAHGYQASDSLTLYLKYTSMPYATTSGGSAAITDDRGLYFINTDFSTPHKPAEIWTQGETEANSHWMITVDKPNTRFTTQIELTVPDTVVTLSNGAMIKQVKMAKGMRTDIWKMDKPIQAYAVMFAIGKFSIIKDHWKNKDVNYYVEPEYAPYARKMFNNTPDMIEYFSQITGIPYPWNKYDQVVVRDYVSGAMENTSASLFGEFMNQDAIENADKNSEDIVSHELFHQWFGDYVTCESWSNITVNESFANYGEQLWRRHRYGDAEADALAWEDLQIYIYTSQLNDPQLVRFNYDNREEVFDAISYNKGGATLHYLNTLIGDAAFDKAMNIYLTKNALHSGEAHNWRLAVEEATGLDWNWFFNEWYYHAGHPKLKVNYNYDDNAQQLTVTITQTQSDSTMNYRLPLKTAILYGSDKTIVDWNITKRKDSMVYAYKNGQRPVIIPDVQHVLPGDIKENKKPAQWLVQYKNSDDYVSKKLAIGGATKAMSDSSSQTIIDLALSDQLKTIRKDALEGIMRTPSDKYHKKWVGKVNDLAAIDRDNKVRSTAMEVLGEWKMSILKNTMLAGVNDSSYMVAGAALEALGKIDTPMAYATAKKLAPTHPRGALANAIWYQIALKGDDADITLFEERAPYIQGPKKLNFAFNLSLYLKHAKSDATYSRGMNIFTQLVNTENMKQYRNGVSRTLFQLAMEYKSNLKSDDKEEAAVAQRRLDITKATIQQIIAAEKDPSAVDDYKKMMKDTFE